MMLKIIRGRHIFRSKHSTNQLLLARNRNALFEVNNGVYGSYIRLGAMSHAASVPFDIPKAKRDQKKVSKDERRAMVESFVNNYRATHNGKFPSVTDAMKDVGGSFYVIRKILQELEYKSKIVSSDRGAENIVGVGLIENELHTTGDVESQNKLNMTGGKNELCATVAEYVEIVDTSDNHLEDEGGSLASFVAGRTLSEEVAEPVVPDGQSGGELGKKEEVDGVSSYFDGTQGHMLKVRTQEVSHPHLENADEREEKFRSDNLMDSGGVKHEEEQYKVSSEPQKKATDISSRYTDDEEEIPKKLTMWGSLKSLADGFISMWKKL